MAVTAWALGPIPFCYYGVSLITIAQEEIRERTANADPGHYEEVNGTILRYTEQLEIKQGKSGDPRQKPSSKTEKTVSDDESLPVYEEIGGTEEEPQYEIPVNSQPGAYKVVDLLPVSDYTVLRRTKEDANGSDYQKLTQESSGYLIPADSRRASYDDIKSTPNAHRYVSNATTTPKANWLN